MSQSADQFQEGPAAQTFRGGEEDIELARAGPMH